MPPLSPIRNSV